MMKRPVNANFDSAHLAEFAKRVSIFSQQEIIDAIDAQINSFIRLLTEFRRNRNSFFVSEIKLTAEAMYTLAEALEKRVAEPNHLSVVQEPRRVRRAVPRRGHYI